MRVIQSARDLRSVLKPFQVQGLSVGFVPTMGALHAGHLSLVKQSKQENAVTVMSIFVNPTQFGPNEDFERYPRDLARDSRLAEKQQVDLLFTPTVDEIYPPGFSTFIEETSLSKFFCGPFRPGHFRGVATVVYRLFKLVDPDRAYFGQKDAQQLRIIEKLVSDLGLNIEIIACPTVREVDGLAMSSRNAYLSEDERSVAPELYRALSQAKATFETGERMSTSLLQIVKNALSSQTKFRIDYVELRRWKDFQETDKIQEKSLLAVALHLGKTRLIDNILLTP